MKSRFLKIILIFIIFINSYYQLGLAQQKISILANSNLNKYFINTDSLIKYDHQKVLDFNNCTPVGDSMETLVFKNRLWFLFCVKGGKGVELFNIDMNTAKLNQVTERSFYKEDRRLFTITSFNDKLFLTTNFSETDHVWNFGLLLIDHENNKEERYIPVNEKSIVRRMYIQNDSLYIFVQPKTAKLNPYYFFTFWLPRERGMKYDWLDNGPPELFVYDKDFILVRREEVPGYDFDYW